MRNRDSRFQTAMNSIHLANLTAVIEQRHESDFLIDNTYDTMQALKVTVIRGREFMPMSHSRRLCGPR